MKALANLKLAGISILLVAGLTACNKPGPAETAGKKIDQAAENTGKKIDQAADDAGKKIGEVTDNATLQMAEQSHKAGVAIDDAEITTKVKAAIFAEPGLKTLQISVITVKGVVTLSGSVDTQQNSNSAKALASAVAGVKNVENKLALKPNK